MCGILAYFGNKITREDFESSLELMDHRGPDYTGFDYSDGVMLGHKRLSIIDLTSSANQPFLFGDYVVVFNGEIYNYIELRKQYNLNTQTNSDTEVLLLMYIKYGEKCLDSLNGMFSFIIYNKKSKIFVARDRLGIKPLYFYHKNDEMIFSSEIASILNLYDSEIDEFGIRQYRKLRMTLGGYTIYKDIKQFPAGSYYMNSEIVKYWDLDMEGNQTLMMMT